MKTIFIKTGTLLIFISSILISCKKDFTEDVAPPKQDNSTQVLSPSNRNHSLILGKKLENPYSLENMKRAYENIRNDFDTNTKIKTSHYYIRYLPANEEELDLIQQDTLIEWYSYPLDYEIIENSEVTSYHDANIPEDKPSWVYAAIPIKHHILKNIKHEILEELYLPEEVEITRGNNNFIEALVDEALKITNNLPEEELNTPTLRRRKKWRPSGRVLVYDDIGINKNSRFAIKCKLTDSRYIPLKGARVRARRWFRTYKGTTDQCGYFTCNGKFRRRANYSIKWESDWFDIRSGIFGQAFYNGPKKRKRWNLTIESGKSLRYATIHRAAYRYCHGYVGGLRRPYLVGNHNLKISYLHKKGSDINGTFNPIFFQGQLPHIRIYGKDNNGWRTTNKIFSTTAHEMTHAAHSNAIGNVNFLSLKKIISESWAEACERQICNIEYKQKLGNTDYKHHQFDHYTKWMLPCKNCSNKKENIEKEYTPLFIDISRRYRPV